MTTADFYIYKIKKDAQGNIAGARIRRVDVDQAGKISVKSSRYAIKSLLCDLLKTQKIVFATAHYAKNQKVWTPMHAVNLVILGDAEYLRIDDAEIAKDDLGQLPEFL
ncbi:hypothetical protein [Wohlfahrtiimonas chitiniclastica]|uniref:hypothetical protein n=1 Tax=Wohlfahrtiimonas chitiniclastica TaxID=400946 RepID=UPI000B99477D|nr:hypothetical protein [Wohlfahrtiimonas chitiniclastica]OYQ74192.1 hypothetical protein B9T18_08765 [Wohlfahrtiimonas chitiniclastica]